MSTYWYFECRSHGPALKSGSEFTQHTDDDKYRRGLQLANERPVERWADGRGTAFSSTTNDYFEANARAFLSEHPTCDLAAISEYGMVVPIGPIDAERDTWAWTNADRTEARRGKFVAVKDYMTCGWAMTHEDFPRTVWRDDQSGFGTQNMNTARQMLTDFLTWQSTQTPPLPAVPKVGDYIRAVLVDGTVEEYEVTEVGAGESSAFVHGEGKFRHIDTWSGLCKDPYRIVSWSPAERPKPVEPVSIDIMPDMDAWKHIGWLDKPKPAWHTPEPGSLWELTPDTEPTQWVVLDHRPSGGVLEFHSVKNAALHIRCTSGLITAGREVTR